MELQVGVKALLKKDNKYLLLKRSIKKYPHANGCWDIPGGRINPGAPLIENLKREIKEETNLNLENNPKLLCAQDILLVPGKHIVRLTFLADIEGKVIIDTEESSEYIWVSIDELKKIENLDRFLKKILEDRLIN